MLIGFCHNINYFGIVLEPNNKTPPIKAKVIPIDKVISQNDTFPVDPTDWNMANKDMTNMSSIIAVPKINVAASSFIIFSLLKLSLL